MNRSAWVCCVAGLLVATFCGRMAWGQTTYFPGESEFGTLLFEDQWPAAGDLDFNDLVLRYNYQLERNTDGNVVSIDAIYQPVAMGTLQNNALALRLPLSSAALINATVTIGGNTSAVAPTPGESDLVLSLSDDLRADLAGGGPGFLNTVPGASLLPMQTCTLHISFIAPVNLPADEPFDLFLHRAGDPSHQVHRSPYYGTDLVDPSLFGTGDDASDPPPGDGGTRWYVTADGMPFVLNIPEQVDHPDFPGLAAYPRENVRIDVAWPDIVAFAASGGTLNTDWYLNPDAEFLYAPVPEPSAFLLTGMVACAIGLIVRGHTKEGLEGR